MKRLKRLIKLVVNKTNYVHMKKTVFIPALVCLLFASEVFAQSDLPSTQGSEFYFSFMRGRNGRAKEMTLLVSSPVDATIILTNPQTGNTRSYNVNANDVTDPIRLLRIASDNDSRENDGTPSFTASDETNYPFSDCYTILPNSPQDKGIYVKAYKQGGNPDKEEDRVKVSLYASNGGSSSMDVANIKPFEALGNEYYVISRDGNNPGTNSGDNGGWKSQALIVATEDGITKIEIAPTCVLDNATGNTQAVIGSGPNEILEPFTVELQKGQTYLLRAYSSIRADVGRNDLTGTRIKVINNGSEENSECKKIAVFSGTQHGSGDNQARGNGDYEYDQLFPVHLWGFRYMVATTITEQANPELPDVIRIVASKPCTEVIVTGDFYVGNDPTLKNEYTTALNPTDYLELRLKNRTDAAFITTSKPVEVALFPTRESNDKQGAPNMIVMAPIEQYLNEITFAAAAYSGISRHQMLVTSLTEICEQTTLNGNPLTDWTEIPSNRNYSTKIVPLYTGISYTLKNDVAPDKGGINAYVYGDGGTIGYGYSVGSAARILSSSAYVNDDPELNDTYLNDPLTTLPCLNPNLSFAVNVYQSFSEIEWDFGDGSPIEKTTGISNMHKYPAEEKEYSVKIVVNKNTSDCYVSTSLQDIIVFKIKITEQIGAESIEQVLCKKAVITSNPNATHQPYPIPGDITYKWFKEGESGFTPEFATSGNESSIFITEDYGESGVYWVETKSGCLIQVDTFKVSVKDWVKNTETHTFCYINPNNENVLQSSKNSEANFDFAWYNYVNDVKTPVAGTAGTLTITNDGTLDGKIYWVEAIKTDGCEAFADTFNIIVPPVVEMPKVDKTLCPDDLLSSATDGAVYLWNTAETTQSISLADKTWGITAQEYWVRTYHNCKLTIDTFMVSVHEELQNDLIKNDFVGAICEMGDQRVELISSESGAIAAMRWEKSANLLNWEEFSVNPLGEKPGVTTYYRVVSKGECNQEKISDEIEIKVNPAFTVEISAPRAEYEPQQEIELTATQNSNIYNYTWYRNNEERYSNTPGEYREYMPQEEMAIVTFRLKLELKISAEDELCTAESNEIIARVVRLPSFISPYTQDGFHDRFAADYDDVVVFNRLGQVVWDSKSQGDRQGWDGRGNNGKLVDPGIYYYVIQTKNDNTEGKPIRKTIEVVKGR